MMDGACTHSSSKVTVEYHDPFGVFPLVSSQLLSRLPLRNLHWKTSNRPLRSIDSLHVELVAGEDGIARPSTAASQESLASSDSIRGSPALDGGDRPGSGPQSFKSIAKERRHQIPGLRRTPYLKIFLLRCDDSETYKGITRKQIREWVRVNTPASTSSGASNAQEKHDACEWLILHVVIPNTLASTQPRFSGSTSSSSGTAKDRSTSTRWPGGKSTTIFEKIRSDFNSSSSHAPDRVAQVRIQNEDLPPERQFPSSAVGVTAFQQTPEERMSAWQDVVAKLKTLILASFDARVCQYEEDIHEKDTQRSLPGWNFCPFFVLKEGLAQSFEGVGLVEDALVLYDELSFGLDTVIQDKTAGHSETDATIFLDATADMRNLVKSLLASDEISDGLQQLMKHPISERNKSYREAILSSNISIFDFKCYLFARQITLLLRLGRRGVETLRSPRPPRKLSHDARRNSYDDVTRKRSFDQSNEDDLGALAEVCRRTLSFVTNTARVLRSDVAFSKDPELDGQIPPETVGNFVASWTVAVVEQILSETASTLLNTNAAPVPISPSKIPKGRTPSIAHEPISAGTEGKLLPARTTSLIYRPSSAVEPAYLQTARGLPGEATNIKDQQARFGFVELNKHRADLYLLQRRTLEQLGERLEWEVGWAALERSRSKPTNGLHDVRHGPEKSSSEYGESRETSKASKKKKLPGLSHSMLMQATRSLEDFRKVYEDLSDNVIRLHMAAGQMRSVEKMLADLAILKYDAGDYAAAAGLFGRITPLFADGRWNHVEIAILRMHGQCLKALNRKDDHVRVLLLILSKAAARSKAEKSTKTRKLASPGMRRAIDSSLSWLDDDDVQARGVLTELVEYSEDLPYEVTVPMGTYFDEITVEPQIRHYVDKDGFHLSLKFRHLLEDDLTADSMQVRLVGTSADQKRDCVLDSDMPIEVKKGLVRCTLHTNVSTLGTFIIERITLKAKKLTFVSEPLSETGPAGPLSSASAVKPERVEITSRSRVFCYPRAESFDAKLCLARHIHIDQTRSIEVECSTGWNDTRKVELRLRSQSAGLRLHIADAEVIEGAVEIVQHGKAQPGLVELADVAAETTFKLRIPYELESHNSDIHVRIDVEYTTETGAFQFFSHARIPVDLPLDINVQDSFKPFALFSTFNIRTPDYKPLRLLGAKLGDSTSLSVQGPLGGRWPRIVFPKKAMSLQFILKQKNDTKFTHKDALPLDIEYQCFDEQISAITAAIISRTLASSDFAHLCRLIVPFFSERVLFHFTEPDYATSATHDEVLLPSFADFGWDDVLDAVSPSLRDPLQTWLKDFHADHPTILLGNINTWSDLQSLNPYPQTMKPADPNSTTRSITISVTIPTVHIIPTASLNIHSYARDYLPTDPTWSIGHARTATLTIHHTRRWCPPAELVEAAGLQDADDPIEFVYEVDANPALWLVGGVRRGTFHQRAGASNALSVDLLLVPLRRGDWAVPSVDVRPARKKAQDRAEKGGEPRISCECYFEDAFQRVLVVPGVRSTTVGLLDGGGTVLLDCVSDERGGGHVEAME